MAAQKERGRRIIIEAGGLEAYDRLARARQGPRMPKLKLESKKQITFDG